MARALAHLASERFAEATGGFRAVLGIDPGVLDAHLGLADALTGRGDRAAAVDGLVNAAARLSERDQDADALRLYAKALALDPYRDALHLDIAILELAMGRHDAAVLRVEALADRRPSQRHSHRPLPARARRRDPAGPSHSPATHEPRPEPTVGQQPARRSTPQTRRPRSGRFAASVLSHGARRRGRYRPFPSFRSRCNHRRSIAIGDGSRQEFTMPIWTFVRHGESLANLEGWLAGQHDTPLTERGRAQAITAREALPRPLPPRAFCSDLQRAHHTALLLLEHEDVPLVVTPRLRERALGSWRRRGVHELIGQRQRMGSWRGRPPGGESLLAVALRVAAWATRVDDSPGDTLVVAHGALMRAVVAAIDRIPRDRLGLGRPRNCEVISRELQVGDWARLLEELREEAVGRDPR